VRHRAGLIVAVVIVLIIIAGVYTVMHVNISALPDPGRFETSIATKAKDWYISRAARGSLQPAPINDASSASTGETLFGMGCATCHGQDGHKPTPIGKSMYPRVLDLGSPEVQEMSDRELFWVMPNTRTGFGKDKLALGAELPCMILALCAFDRKRVL
jgi:cytochrome c553